MGLGMYEILDFVGLRKVKIKFVALGIVKLANTSNILSSCDQISSKSRAYKERGIKVLPNVGYIDADASCSYFVQ